MKYSLFKNHHSDFSVFDIGTLAPRAYFIPFSGREKADSVSFRHERTESDRVRLLSGEWDFKYYRHVSALPGRLDTSRTAFDKISVPCTWQRTGYEPPVYLNCPYPFKTELPAIPEDMSAAIYRRTVEIEDTDKIYTLSFLGISSCADVYVNGEFVGYTEGSHNTAEFDITPLIKKGENEIVAVSFKWCNGTLLECQDMFRENGIFRDVLLYVDDKTYIRDIDIRTEKTGDSYTLDADIAVEGDTEGYEAVLSLEFDGRTVARAALAAGKNTCFSFPELSVTQWNAEIPTVYEMYVSLVKDGETKEIIRRYVGFRKIEILKDVFFFNGKKIKLKGVNHHDTHLTKGYAMSLEDLERDIRLMKSLNVNCVRTSHYPPDPFFITLADIYGVYIVDEADIETHGCWEMCGEVSAISHDLKWAKHYVDRVRRMYYRDRGHASIIMWSLGNEAGGYHCQDKCYEYLKKTGTDIPVHYEGVSDTKRFCYDVVSHMYTDTYELYDIANNRGKRGGQRKKAYDTHPFFLCEYCHAMGVGPGNLEEYWDLFYKYDRLLGGCIWEWADHTVKHELPDDKYKYKYTYGGDHGEKKHDGHFCVDGLVYSDRMPHTGALEMKVVYRPLRAEALGDKVYRFTNTNRFRSSGYLRILWELQINGEVCDSGVLFHDIAPEASADITVLHKDIPDSADVYINFTYLDGDTVVAVEQVELQSVDFACETNSKGKIAVENDGSTVKVLFEDGSFTVNSDDGAVISYIFGGKEYINPSPAGNRGFTPNLTRAFIDNDARNISRWTKVLSGLTAKKSLFAVRVCNGFAIIEAYYRLMNGRHECYGVYESMVVYSGGEVKVYTDLTVSSEDAEADLPRFGLMLEMPRSFENVRYYGRGCAENMPDFKAQAPIGIYSSKVEAMFEKYVYPQESGMHCDTKWLEITDSDGAGLRFAADSEFNFSVHHFTQSLLNKAAHQEDVHDENTTVVTLDGFTRGIGTSSCGPDTRKEYRKDAREDELSLCFTMVPFSAGK